MISIVKYCITEGWYGELDNRFQQTSLAKRVDKINDNIDKKLAESSLGRKYMRAEKKVGKVVEQGANAVYNFHNRMLMRNFKRR